MTALTLAQPAVNAELHAFSQPRRQRPRRDDTIPAVPAEPPARPGDDPPEPDDPSDLDELELPCTDDASWEVFIADDDERDPQPEWGDFWNDELTYDRSPNDD